MIEDPDTVDARAEAPRGRIISLPPTGYRGGSDLTARAFFLLLSKGYKRAYATASNTQCLMQLGPPISRVSAVAKRFEDPPSELGPTPTPNCEHQA